MNRKHIDSLWTDGGKVFCAVCHHCKKIEKLDLRIYKRRDVLGRSPMEFFLEGFSLRHQHCPNPEHLKPKRRMRPFHRIYLWWLSKFCVISKDKALRLGLVWKRNIYGDEILYANARSVWREPYPTTIRGSRFFWVHELGGPEYKESHGEAEF